MNPMEPYNAQEAAEPDHNKSGIKRDAPDPKQTEANRRLVTEWVDKVRQARSHWQPQFQQMREDMDFYMGKQWIDGDPDRYVANLVQRQIQNRVAALYARNPRVVCKRRKTIDFAVWNGDPSEFQNAQVLLQQSMMTGMPPDPRTMALIQDIQQGTEKRRQADRVAKTLEIVFAHFIESQALKPQMKQLIRRVCVTGVGFLKLGYHRVMGQRPEDLQKVTDITEQLSVLERLMADCKDDEISEDSAKAEQLRILLQELAEKQDMVVDEGIVFDFPTSNSIIVDPRCRQLKGFVGAEWVAQEFLLTVDEVKEVYKVDLGTHYTRHNDVTRVEITSIINGGAQPQPDPTSALAKVYEIYCKRDGIKYVVAEGYPEFLTEPDEPELKLRRFWPFFVLSFNEVEHERKIYPLSDVRLMMDAQKEYNLARQRLREHRHANRPLYVTPTGMLTKEEGQKLMERQPHEIIQLQALQPGQAAEQVLQVLKPAPVDPALYDTSVFVDDILRTVGSQEANFGSTGSSTATEVSVAEGSRQTAIGSAIDELDEFLIDLSRASGEVLLAQMNAVTAQRIAGIGASWPTMSPQDISDQLLLEIEAGSSGRPNKAAEVQTMERILPILMQLPGVSPVFIAREVITRWDDAIDVEDALLSGIPSIVAQNAQKQLGQPGIGQPPGAPQPGNPQAAVAGATPAPQPNVAPGQQGPNLNVHPPVPGGP